MSVPELFPPRLHVLMAPRLEGAQARFAVVLRRGPSKEVCTIGWDLSRDSFEEGQWLRGRIYERRSDLSPDGQFLLYFAANNRASTETGGSWTAISKAPWLHALVLLGKGDGWHGGGLFTGRRRYWLNDGYGHRLLRSSTLVDRNTDHHPSPSYGGECPGVYYHRLIRDGWLLRSHDRASASAARTIFEKDLGRGWLLRKIAHEQVGPPKGKGCYWDEHEVENSKFGVVITHPDWEWAELDYDRLVFACRGCLYSMPRPQRDAAGEPRLIKDFQGMAFRERSAPYQQ